MKHSPQSTTEPIGRATESPLSRVRGLTGLELIDIHEVQRLTQFRSREAIYRRMRLEGPAQFPQPVKLSHRCSRWLLREVLAWIESQAAQRGIA